jgi:hypothetical protein
MKEIEKDSRSWMSHERGNLFVIGSALLLALGAYFWRLHVLRVRYFCPDEFEHLHAAWSFSKGLLPYRDFFEHHTPWLYFFLAPFFRFYDVDTKVADAQAFFFFARTWMWIFTGVILVLTFWVARLWRDARVGCVAALFLGNTRTFLDKTIEVRPDVLSAALWLACLIAVVRGIREEEFGRKSRWRFAWSGIFLGAALMCTQKMLFALPGFGLAMLWYLFDARSLGTRRQRFWNIAYQVLGFCLPILLTLGYFAVRGAIGEFIEYNFLINFRWKSRFAPTYFLKQLVKDNPVIVGLAVSGFFSALWGMFGRERFRRSEYLCVLSVLGLFCGLFIIQQPHPHYYLMFLPLAAVLASCAFLEVMDWAAAAVQGQQALRLKFVLYIVIGTCALVALVIPALKMFRPHLVDLLYANGWGPGTFQAELWLLALGSAAVCLLFRRENLAVAALLGALSLYPFKVMLLYDVDQTNRTTLNEIRYVLQNTSPTDICMDGWTGLGVFRPHAWYYWHLPDDVRPMISESSINEFAANLRSGSIAPKFIFYDQDLKDLSPGTTEFFEKHYESTGESTSIRIPVSADSVYPVSIWRRK